MRKTLVAAAVAVCFVSSGAVAQERVGDAALGALSGALVLGPIGAIAGAAVGYTAGPAIARSWGLRGNRSSRRARSQDRNASSDPGRGGAATSAVTGSSRTAASPAPPARRPSKSASALPPSQGLD